jgi:hypothetical protein
MASQYVGLCEDTMRDEDSFLLSPLPDQIPSLRSSCHQLGKD